MTKSGLLLGVQMSASSQVIIQGMCAQFTIDANTTFNSFGIVGYAEGNITVKQAYIIFNITAVTVNYLGVVGNISSSSKQSSFQDLFLQQQLQYTSGGSNSALVGYLYAQASTLYNIQLNNSLQNGTGVYGGFIALSKSDVQIKDSVANNSIIVSTGNTGAITGQSVINQRVQNIIIANCFINSSQYVGSVLGYSDSDITIQNGDLLNSTLISSQNLGGYIGIIQIGRQVQVFNANSSNMIIVSVTACSAGTIIGLSNANDSVSGSYTKNINISNLNGGAGSGSIIAYSVVNASVVDCHSENILLNSTTRGTGGIIGWSNILIVVDCSVINTQIESSLAAGGISGFQNNKATIISCYSDYNSIYSIAYAGGIIGNANITLTQIRNTSSVNCNVTSTSSVAGGIFGISSSVIMDSCFVNYLSTISGAQSGGMIGITVNSEGSIIIQNVTVQNINLHCLNGNSVGSIIGIVYLDTVINRANIYNVTIFSTLATGAGGVVGYSLANVQMINCAVNNLNINSTAAGSGGIIGYSNITSIVNCSVTNSVINSTSSSGGIMGYQIANTTIIDSQTLIQNASVKNVSLSSVTTNYCGGFVGYYVSSIHDLSIKGSTISFVAITSKALQAGIVVGKSLLTAYSVTNSGSDGVNTINNVVQANCDNFIFTSNVKGC
ncbi:Conserved_hypothetical protein [Hexamita inflata]|uniref:Uncharacterized protein n=1 Tax=Hexamita inflata TaxID=28002 RepID=A0AA86S510_9EUKA|nr:Conserved hypothetical protein [Hexamita inflata]